jgi:hypothetical protein
VEVLVSRGGAEEGGSDDSLGEHLESWFGWKCCVRVCTTIDLVMPDHEKNVR